MLEEFVQARTENPMPQKKRDGYSIYQSHNQFGPLRVQLWDMLKGKSRTLFANIHSSYGKYMASNHLAQMIALLGRPSKELIMPEHRMRNWNFAPAIGNGEDKLCHNTYEFYHGPFFDSEGNARNHHYQTTLSLNRLIRVCRKVFVS